jgi:hypothetical protein
MLTNTSWASTMDGITRVFIPAMLTAMFTVTSDNLNAQIYRCKTDSGGTLFTNAPCDPTRTISVDGVPYEEVKRRDKERQDRAQQEYDRQAARRSEAAKAKIAAEEEIKCREKVRAENPHLFRGAIASHLRGVTLDDDLCKRSR